MNATLPVDLDFLVARLHGRRRHLAEADRLDALCRLRTLPDLARTVLPDTQSHSVGQLQQEFIRRVVQELADFAEQLTGAGSRLMQWMRTRYQIENLKVLARVFATGKSLDLAREHLVSLPADLALNIEALATADSLESFAAATPSPVFERGLIDAATTYAEEPKPIILEAALDRVYLRELIARSKALPREPRQDSSKIARQEADTFLLMLVARGRFTYGLQSNRLALFHVNGAGISQQRFSRMLAAENLRAAARESVGLVLDRLPESHVGQGGNGQDLEPAVLEAMAWNRYLRLAHRAFRRSHMGMGAVIAFAAIRRIELANLITLSEGIRAEMDPDVIRSRLLPTDTEAMHV